MDCNASEMLESDGWMVIRGVGMCVKSMTNDERDERAIEAVEWMTQG